jgi:methionyl-tRNA synthetase
MTPSRVYLSTTIPYVNSRAHLGHALELVQADVLARHHRRLGDDVRFQSGTDDNSLKNVLAAEAAGCSTRELVAANGRAFAELSGPLALSFDDYIHTSTDPRHQPGVERLWRACAARGDLYRKDYAGLYCVGCERFCKPAELTAGRCPEHGSRPQLIAERNWFFRLSRYAGQLQELIGSGRLRIEPAARRNEVLGFIAGGLEDFSASRSTERARGWGIGVPGDRGQVIYVWWDALGNYITAPGYGTGSGDYQRWWAGADRRIHLVGKGVLRFHAVYWPAILLSAGEPLPTEIVVHDYLTAGGRKISKSAARGDPDNRLERGDRAGLTVQAEPTIQAELTDPVELVARYGTDAVRWWLLSAVPRVGDTDFTAGKLVQRANRDLANGLGNLVSRVTSLARARYQTRPGPAQVPAPPAADAVAQDPVAKHAVAGAPVAGDAVAQDPVAKHAVAGAPVAGDAVAQDPVAKHAVAGAPVAGDAVAALSRAVGQAPGLVREALDGFDFRAAIAACWQIVELANRYAEITEPWHLARAARAGDTAAADQLDGVLATLLHACRALAGELSPFVPDLAGRIAAACGGPDGVLPEPGPLFPRLTVVPDAVVPDAVVPDAVVPDAVVPDAVVPDAVVPDPVAPDAVVPDAVVPDAVVPDPVAPDPVARNPVVPDPVAPGAAPALVARDE